ncbi:putative zinc finger transcriptional activator of the zn2cys6 [Golovinomyces cichoracearum]|uniref:Putative zinc finger transcriptional activator of the zn2cys6 n=1 Tax=Golovinomyces cichoracearum TaxID=62708 RepID=A0A420J6Z6_9PEZI|nr:putative zinc finger transcriptional activator of the zn2cys6 [Golovinomyces cichoracearum]
MSATGYSVPFYSDRSDEPIGTAELPAAQISKELDRPQHKRVYQACIPCRRRKVKCDLGSVDNPNDPPCVRCRRESKECFFSATRRKRKLTGDGKEDIADHEYFDDYAFRNGRKIVSKFGSPPAPPSQCSVEATQTATPSSSVIDSNILSGNPLTPGGSIGRSRPLRRPTNNCEDPQICDRVGDSNTQLENLEAQEVMRQQVYGPYDALDLLYKAATDNKSMIGEKIDHQLSTGARESLQYPQEPSSNMMRDETHHRQKVRCTMKSRPDKNTDSTLSSGPSLSTSLPSKQSPEKMKNIDRTKSSSYDDAIKAWARFRFVRAGWFTAAEAIDYIDYYYEYLSPLTPISPPTFRDPATHLTLLTEEPFLAVTLLSIAARFRQIPDAGGRCRSYAIHEQLWTYLRGMIERCLWGQEALGSRLNGPVIEVDSGNTSLNFGRRYRKGNLRDLGTIESLLILTEWHPRALHFPPVDVTDELMIPSHEEMESHCTEEKSHSRLPCAKRGIGGKRIESWLEPAWRSDRMCWMLLSTAMGLSYELGVFDKYETLLATSGEISRQDYEEEAYRLRATRIKRLLLIYMTQLAGRLGWTSMVPENLRSTDPLFARRPVNLRDPKAFENQTCVSNNFNYIPDLELDDQVIYCWAGITNVMRQSNETLFNSRQHTTKIIQDGSYIELLRNFQPKLHDWKKEFELFRLPPYIRHVLNIEYEYIRIYINSLSLQAVVERCTNHAELNASTSGKSGISTTKATLSPAVRDYYGKLPLAQLGGIRAADQKYVKEVVDGSRNLLTIVVEGLLPNDYLKHAPVRTYFRIISGAMFLLKTFALGASKSDVETSIRLMDRAVDALRNCIVDDVHLGNQFADLLETLTSRLRNRFVIAPAGPTSNEFRDQNRGSNYPESKEKRTESWDTSISDTPSLSDSHNNKCNSEYGISATSFGPTPFSSSILTTNTSSTHKSDYDLFNNNVKIQDLVTGAADWNPENDVWYLPPGMAFFENINDQAVAQTSKGVNVGGMDLLDFMALDPLEPFGDMPTL